MSWFLWKIRRVISSTPFFPVNNTRSIPAHMVLTVDAHYIVEMHFRGPRTRRQLSVLSGCILHNIYGFLFHFFYFSSLKDSDENRLKFRSARLCLERRCHCRDRRRWFRWGARAMPLTWCMSTYEQKRRQMSLGRCCFYRSMFIFFMYLYLIL